MSQSIFMRVLFCKIHCPSFICFCKPAVAHLYNPGPLKLENTQHVPSTFVSVTDSSDQLSCEVIEDKQEEIADGNEEAKNGFKSCIKKEVSFGPGAPKEVIKKKVQWMDNLGKELVEIKEFGSNSDTGDIDSEMESGGCVCIIL
ncbi:hypothetical protein U1Q18_032008 [Sarracenia purpurea var. burkii]